METITIIITIGLSLFTSVIVTTLVSNKKNNNNEDIKEEINTLKKHNKIIVERIKKNEKRDNFERFYERFEKENAEFIKKINEIFETIKMINVKFQNKVISKEETKEQLQQQIKQLKNIKRPDFSNIF